MADSYYDLPDWSYSQMKIIIDSGIDYAVAAKQGLMPKPASKSIDLGQLAHMFVLGGHAEDFVKSPYADFRTKEARDWRDETVKAGKTIVTHDQYQAISSIVDNIEAHPMSQKLLKGKNVKHEQEMFGLFNGINVRGKADAMLREFDAEKKHDVVYITDIKTTAQFDEWKYKAMRRHYDLQATIYSMLCISPMPEDETTLEFYFCVVETVFPYRVQYHHASKEFIEHGQVKLANCLLEIANFGDKEPNFLIKEINELGDFSL